MHVIDKEPKFIAKADGTIEQIKNCSDCEIVQACVEAGIRSTARALSVLDKIRAEIENTMKYQYAVGENEYAEGFEKSLEIIDKYKAESEEKSQ